MSHAVAVVKSRLMATVPYVKYVIETHVHDENNVSVEMERACWETLLYLRFLFFLKVRYIVII